MKDVFTYSPSPISDLRILNVIIKLFPIELLN